MTTQPTEHPDFDRWVEYHAGNLAAADKDAMQEHLTVCARCTGLLVDMEDFLAPPEGPEAETLDFEREAVWRAIRPHRQPRWRVPLSIAAAFLVGVLGVGVWTSGERQELRQLEQVMAQLTAPQPNAPIYHLVPTTRSSRSSQQGFPLAEEMQTFTLVFNLVAEDPDATFRAELLDTQGQVALEVPDLELDELGTLTLGLSRRSLSPGDYVVHLYSMGREDEADENSEYDEAPKPEASYNFRLGAT